MPPTVGVGFRFPSGVPNFLAPVSAPTSVAPDTGLPLTDDCQYSAALKKRLGADSVLASSTENPVFIPKAATIASASSSQITINTWSVYDPTTGPVLPLAPVVTAPPQVLPDDAGTRKQRRDRALASSTAEPTPFVSVAIPQVLADDGPLRRPKRKALDEGTAAPVGVAPGQFLPNFLPQWLELAQLSRIKPNEAAAASATADPVFQPAPAAPPQVLPDERAFRKQRQSGVLALSTAEPTPPVFVGVPQVLPDERIVQRQRKGVPLASSSAEPIFIPAPAVAPPIVLLDEGATRPGARKKVVNESAAPVGVALGQFLPSFVPQWSEQFQLYRLKPNKAAAASSSADPVLATAAAIVAPFASASSSQIVQHSWSIHDRTTGPVNPPAVPFVQTLVDAQSDIKPRKSMIGRPWPTSIVIAIPYVDDLWFEALDIPIRLKVKGKFTETVQPLVPLPPPPAVMPFASASSSQIVIHSRMVYDPTTGPVLRPVLFVPPLLPDPTVFQRLLRKKSFDIGMAAPVTIAPGQFLANFVSQWAERPQATKKWPNPGRFDQTSSPTFPPPPLAPVLVSQWLEQFTLAKRRWQKGVFAPAVIPELRPLPNVFPPILGAIWLEQSLVVRQAKKRRFTETAQPLLLLPPSPLVTAAQQGQMLRNEIRRITSLQGGQPRVTWMENEVGRTVFLRNARVRVTWLTNERIRLFDE